MKKKRFAQYFMPYQQIGAAYHAFRALCLNFENDCVPLYAAGNAGEIMAEALDDTQAIDQKALTLLSAETAELLIRDAGRIPQAWILRHSRPLQMRAAKCDTHILQRALIYIVFRIIVSAFSLRLCNYFF